MNVTSLSRRLQLRGLDHIIDPSEDCSWMLFGLRPDGTYAGGQDEFNQALPNQSTTKSVQVCVVARMLCLDACKLRTYIRIRTHMHHMSAN